MGDAVASAPFAATDWTTTTSPPTHGCRVSSESDSSEMNIPEDAAGPGPARTRRMGPRCLEAPGRAKPGTAFRGRGDGWPFRFHSAAGGRPGSGARRPRQGRARAAAPIASRCRKSFKY